MELVKFKVGGTIKLNLERAPAGSRPLITLLLLKRCHSTKLPLYKNAELRLFRH